MFNLYNAVNISNKLGIVFDKFSINDFLTGINIEKKLVAIPLTLDDG